MNNYEFVQAVSNLAKAYYHLDDYENMFSGMMVMSLNKKQLGMTNENILNCLEKTLINMENHEN